MGQTVRRTVRQLSVLLAAILIAACAASPGKVSQSKTVDELDLQRGLALRGYDPVAYFTDRKPSAGNPAISYRWHGATWLFSSDEHRAAFIADPAHYAPQFGGYCAFAVSRGTTATGDPHQWAVVDDKLYLNTNAFAQTLWNTDRPGNIQAGQTNWPLIPKRPPAGGESTQIEDPSPSAPPRPNESRQVCGRWNTECMISTELPGQEIPAAPPKECRHPTG
jgi:hypothetical protein